MLEKTTGPVTVEGYAARKDRDGNPKTWRGTDIPLEVMQYRVDGEDRYRTDVLDKAMNGSRPEVGAVVHLVLHSRPWQTARDNQIRTDYLDNIVATVPFKA